MRIPGVQVPPGYFRWAALGFGVLLFAVAVMVVANALGLSGFPAESSDRPGTRVMATVSAGAPCDRARGNERVTFTRSGREEQARFDGCGHTEGEQVEITVPADPGGDMVVQAAQAAVGTTAGSSAGLGSLLLVVASLAGAAYALLLRRRGIRG